MQRRPMGFVIAAAGLAVLVIALLGTPDASGWVLAAWILVLASVAAVAAGLVMGFRHQARVADERTEAAGHYLTADWLAGAQLFTVGEGVEPPEPAPEPAPVPTPSREPMHEPQTIPEVQPAAVAEPRPATTTVRSPRMAAALMAASAIRELIRPGRAAG